MGTIQIKKVERTVTTGKTGFRNFDFVEVTFARKYKEKQHFPLYFAH
jgi:hypothetical protein